MKNIMSGHSLRKSLEIIITCISAAVILFSSFQYQNYNDLAIYQISILESGYYAGDFLFENLQLIIFFLFGESFVLSFLQFLVVMFAYFIYLKNRGRNGYPLFLLVFISPLFILGLFNSIRQVLATLIILVTYDGRQKFSFRIILSFCVALLIHQASIVLIFLLIIRNLLLTRSLRIQKSLLNVLILSVLILFLVYVSIFAVTIWDRYSVYLSDGVIYTAGRYGIEKFIPWSMVWFLLLLLSFQGRKVGNSLSLIGLIYTFFLLTDCIMRGFDEFHSRMLLINNALLLILSIETVKRETWVSPKILIIFSVNVFNPSSWGVLL